MADALHVLTWNVKMLPTLAKLVISPVGEPRGWWEAHLTDEARARLIVEAVRTHQPAYDIVCFQEVFDEGIRKVLADGLGAGFHLVKRAGDDDLDDDSGLFVASRLPIVWYRFEEYHASAGSDAFSDKGVLGLCLDPSTRFPGVPAIYWFTTHMQSDVSAAPTRLHQMRQLRRFIADMLRPVEATEEVLALLCGDFNVIGESRTLDGDHLAPTAEYQALVSHLGHPRDLFRTAHPAEPGVTWDGLHNAMTPANDRTEQRIDYLFAFDFVPAFDTQDQPAPLRRFACAEVAVRPEPAPSGGGLHLSDHYAVEATLTL